MSEVERILFTIKRHVAREHKIAVVDAELRIWFEQRMAYLRKEYADAINRDDSIIGKQWLMDRCPKMRQRYYGADGRKALEAAGFPDSHTGRASWEPEITAAVTPAQQKEQANG